MPKNTKLIKLLGLKRNAPLEIFKMLEEMKDDLRAEIIDELKNEKKQTDIFGNLEPAKLLASKVAKDEINSFKDLTNDQINAVIESIKSNKKELKELIAQEIKRMNLSMGSDKSEMIKTTKGSIEKLERETAEKINEIIRNVESMKGPKGDRGPLGIPGKDGIDGKDGKDGKEGSPDTPDQIAKKINTLEEKIERKTIKGLENEIRALHRMVKGGQSGGGGMGNIIPEVPTGSGTSFSITYTPKSNSLILLRNGIFQRNGASYEYTLSGKTLTLSSSLGASEELFAWYVRA